MAYTGFNGENWFQAQDELTKQWLIDFVPSGESFTLRFRADKDEFNPQDIDKLIELSEFFEDNNRSLKVIYCANIKSLDAQLQFDRIKQVINAGVNVLAVEFGNEVYSGTQANFNFETYRAWFEPLKVLIEAEYPYLPMLVFLAPRAKDSEVLGGRTDHKAFNDAAIDYINARPTVFPTIHIYMNARECPVLETKPEKVELQAGVKNEVIDTFYSTLLTQASLNVDILWDNTLNYLSARMPNKAIYITEWGFDNYGDIKNVIALGDFAWNVWLKRGKDVRIECLLQHNGVSMAGPGMIFPVHPQLDIPTVGGNNKRRIDYFVYAIYRLFLKEEVEFLTGPITAPGKYAEKLGISDYAYANIDENMGTVSVGVSPVYIGGQYIYSSAGATEWMAKTSPQSYEIGSLETNPNTPKPYMVGFTILHVDIVTPINNPPVAVISPEKATAYVGDSVSASGESSYDPDGDPITYRWIVDGTVVGTNPKVSVSRSTTGTLALYLEVMDDKGLKNTTVAEFTFIAKPVTNRPWWCKYPAVVALFERLGINTSVCKI